MMKYDSFLGMPMMRSGSDASSAGGFPMRLGVTTISVARAKIERTMAPRIHSSRSTPVAMEPTGINVRRAPLGSRLVGAEMQEGRHAEQACAQDRRQETRPPAFECAVHECADGRNRKCRGTE